MSTMTGTLKLIMDCGGLPITGSVSETGQSAFPIVIAGTDVGAGTAASFTRSDADTATITFTGSNPLSDADVVDIVWTESGVQKARYGMITSGKADLTIVVGDGGSNVGEGDSFPAGATSCVVCKQYSRDFAVNGAQVKMLTLFATQNAMVTFRTSVPATVKHFALVANKPVAWWLGSGITNPLGTSDVATIKFTSSTTTAAEISLNGIYDLAS